jgi:cytochrome c-type biogenesis protein CcmH/NrfF
MSSKSLPCALAILLSTAASGLAANGKPTLKSVGSGLVCQCGCNIPVSEPCQHYECSYHAEMRALIQKEIAEGKDETAIHQDFVLRYGVQVLAAPPTKGFNLTVWILPGAGLLAGLLAVVIIARRWRGPIKEKASAPTAPMDPKLLAAIENEIKSSGLGVRD